MRRITGRLLLGIACLAPRLAGGDDRPPMPKVADGWSVETIAEAPAILFPTAAVVAPDGTIYLGQDPMDMPGPPSKPIDSVVAIKDGKVRAFADGLHAVMGLEWSGGTLYVVHAPFLSAFSDADGDGRADRRVDLVTGLGPENPAFSGINDHIASGLRLGMDGFLYIAVGDKGIPRGVGRDGKAIRLKGGGVVRVRPDGTDLEIVSTGERNPLSVALTPLDDVFTFGNDDDGKKWPNSLTHHIDGGHYGYPYEFLNAPWRCLPIAAGQLGGAGAQAVFYDEDGLPDRYRGSLFVCDWGLQAVFRYELARAGATYKVVKREPFVTKGGLGDFRPFSIAVGADRSSLVLVDWAYNGWLADGPKTGRLFRLRCDRPGTTRPSGSDRIADLGHPSRSVRLEAGRELASKGDAIVPELVARTGAMADPSGRVQAVWTLDAIGSPAARSAIRGRLKDRDGDVRAQAARSIGVRRERAAVADLAGLLRDPDAVVRREAAIALGRLGDASAAKPLYAALGDPDRFVDWSVRAAIRRLGAWSADELTAALRDPKRRDAALVLADESWAVPAVEALVAAFAAERDAAVRARILANLAGQFRKYPEWTGHWFGTNPLAGAFPAKTVDWDRAAMGTILVGLTRGLLDAEADVRRRAIVGLATTGTNVTPTFLAALPREADPTNRAAMIAALGQWGDPKAVAALGRYVKAADQPLAVRLAALDALGGINSREAFNLRFAVVFDPGAPPELVARALPSLGRMGVLPPNDLAGFLIGKPAPVQVAAMEALRGAKGLPAEVVARLVAKLDDAEPDVRSAAIDAVGRLRLAEAVPKLVAMAKDAGTRAEATRALAAIPDERALDVYLDALGDRDPDLRRLGESALLRLRGRVAGELTRRAKSGAFSGPTATAVERVLADFRPVVDWRVIGPFARTTAQVFFGEPSIDFARAHSGVEGRPIRWAARLGDAKTGRVVLDDFKGGLGDRGGFGYDANGSPDLAAFAFAEVRSDADRDAMLLVGSSGSVAVSVNETIVFHGGGPRPGAPGSDLVRVRLRKGSNRLLLRVRQGVGPWSFGVLLSEPSDPIFAAKPATAGVDALRAFALNHSGDSRKGEELFFDPKGIGCARCHAADGRGEATVGPDLTGLALKYDKAEIIRSVLEPSARIATGYQPAIVARKDGAVLTGLIRSETDGSLELVDAGAKVVTVPKSAIEERKVGDVSLMPAGQVAGLAPVDFADLVAYLLSLKSAPSPPATGRP